MNLLVSLERARRRFDLGVLGRIAQAAIAAGLAWELAILIPDHNQPFFAPIAAVIALGAERGRRGREAVEMLFGVALGIMIGASVTAAFGSGGWQLVLAVAAALVAGTALGARPLTRNEAAVSAILIVALPRVGSTFAVQRLEDALIGGGIAIVLAQLLFPIDPLELVADEAWRLREELADVLDEAAAALRKHDAERAQGVLVRLDGIDDRRHYDALALARDVARRAPRRRPLQRRLDLLGTVAHELGAAVADARAVATGTLRILGSGRPPPPEAAEAVEAAAAAIRTTEPGAVRDAAEHARTVALRATEADDSLGTGVLAHAVVAIADHALRTVEAREEHQRRVAEEPASRVQGFPFRERRGDSEREAS